jgi:hypothetical protein
MSSSETFDFERGRLFGDPGTDSTPSPSPAWLRLVLLVVPPVTERVFGRVVRAGAVETARSRGTFPTGKHVRYGPYIRILLTRL